MAGSPRLSHRSAHLAARAVALALLLVGGAGAAAHAQPYMVDKWSAQWGARWALEAFVPVNRLLVWRGPIRVMTLASPDLSSLARYGEERVQSMAGQIGLANDWSAAATPGQANFVVCAGPTYRSTNDFCDAAYLAFYRNDWFARGLSLAMPDPVAGSANENPPLLPHCAFFADGKGSIGAAFISLSSLDDGASVDRCLMQGLGLSFWKIDAFFHADYSTDENTYGFRNHELSLLKAAYLADRTGCPNGTVDVACFEAWLNQLDPTPLSPRQKGLVQPQSR